MNDSNVTEFPLYNLTSVPESLRKLAKFIEDNPDCARRVVVVIETDHGVVDYKAFGEDFSRAHAVGLLHFAQLRIIGN